MAILTHFEAFFEAIRSLILAQRADISRFFVRIQPLAGLGLPILRRCSG
jgi:hypothetical protein